MTGQSDGVGSGSVSVMAAVEKACEALVAAGAPITFSTVAETAGVARNTLFRYPEAHEMVTRWRRQHPLFPRIASRPSAGPLDDLAREWVGGRVARKEITGRSEQTESWRLEALVRLHGQRPAGDLDRRVIMEWLESIADLSPSTRKAARGTVQRFAKWLVREGHLEVDPTLDIARVREPKTVPRALTLAEVAKAIEACRSDRERAVIWLMLGCGLRSMEVSSLDIADYDPASRVLMVKGKFSDERKIPVPQATAEAIATYREGLPAAGPLIRATGNKALPSGRLSAKWVSKMVSRLMRRAGVHSLDGPHPMGDLKSGHALRHTFATDCLAATGDLLAVRDLLGHSSLYVTQRYLAPPDQKRLRQAVEGRAYVDGGAIIPMPPRASTGQTVVTSPAAITDLDEIRHQRQQTVKAETTNLHCPSCCHDPKHGADCGGWQPIMASSMVVTSDRQSRTGWSYSAACPQCERTVDGDLFAWKAKDLLDRGAARG